MDKPRVRVRAGSDRVASELVVRGEGDFRPGPYQLPVTGGWLPDGAPINWWQLDYNPISLTRSAMVEACVSAYSQTIAMCPGDHWRMTNKGGRSRVKNSALARILRHPNDYQSISDLLLNAVRNLYTEGNAYALCLRNDRYEIDELHLMNSEQSFPQLAYNGEIFYGLYGNDVINKRLGSDGGLLVPQRDVLHVKLHTCRRAPTPLIGESPIVATYDDIGIGSAIAKQQAAFYINEARPSAVLSTDLVLDKDQTQALRDRWNEQTRLLKQGGTPILTAGLKVQPWSTSSKDSTTAEILKISNEHIALAFRIPLPILGLGGTAYASTELLMQSWIATGLGFAINHVEEAFGLTFELKGQPEEYVEFDTAALLRSAMKDRMEALSKATIGGILSPNEARAQEGYDEVPFGDEPRVQQQVVPLSAVDKIPAAPGPGAPPGPPAPPAIAPPKTESTPLKGNVDVVERTARNIIRSADAFGR